MAASHPTSDKPKLASSSRQTTPFDGKFTKRGSATNNTTTTSSSSSTTTHTTSRRLSERHGISKNIHKPSTTGAATLAGRKKKKASKAATTSSVVPTRKESDVLLAIKPIHLGNIISRQKNHEYRKYRLRDGVTRLWFYETKGDGKGRGSITYNSPFPFPILICYNFLPTWINISLPPPSPRQEGEGATILHPVSHIAVIPSSTRHMAGSVPTEPFGIGNEDFNAGLKESKYGYPIQELYELVRPIQLAEMKRRFGMGGAPMGWSYVKSDMWEDRWGGGHDGDEEDRVGKVNRVF